MGEHSYVMFVVMLTLIPPTHFLELDIGTQVTAGQNAFIKSTIVHYI